MLPMNVQDAINELEQVDLLLELVLTHIVKDPDDMRDREWFVKLENALCLLESTYKEKKKNLLLSLSSVGI